MAGKIKAKAFPRRQPGVMNKLEERFWDDVQECIRLRTPIKISASLEIIPIEIRFEKQPLKIASKRCSYMPDFKIIASDGFMYFVETKGFWQDDARVKIKDAADDFWEYRFLAAQWKKSTGWTFEEF